MTFKNTKYDPEFLRKRALTILANYSKPYLDSWELARIASIPEPVAATIMRQSKVWREVGFNDGPVTYTKFKKN